MVVSGIVFVMSLRHEFAQHRPQIPREDAALRKYLWVRKKRLGETELKSMSAFRRRPLLPLRFTTGGLPAWRWQTQRKGVA